MDNNRIDIKNIPVKVETYKPELLNQAKYASRDRIYVRSVKGLHQSLRRNMGFIFMALFMLLPWIQYNGKQAILLNIGEQKFNIFALTLWPQDFTILAWIFVISAYALFFVTAFYGRVWCGYLCPQSVWTFIFMWFEEKIQGTRNQRMTLDQAPWSATKFFKKALTHFCWLAFALLTSLIFVGYFTPVGPLFIEFFTFEAGFWAVVSVLFFTACTYGNAGWMREIMCTHICPYARFQSAMFDKDTFTVTYDEQRGENRGPRSRKDKNYKEKGLGDCIDCNLCVHVCPTGIDIRNGLQYECINCGACIDACDDTMAKMGYPPGLISYTTEHSLNGKPTKILRPKLVGYFIILLVVCAAFGTNLYLRKPLELDIIRDRGALYRETPEGLIENTYTLSIINKSQQAKTYQLTVSGVNDFSWIGPTEVTIAGGDNLNVPVSLALDPYSVSKPILDIEFSVTELSDDGYSVSQGNKFFAGR
ncbi:MAG: cytochrome c oxidase accessory protein CcoG [Rheinheimera sp.]|uniref:cytochrome c oxidase accessory protein CcoG n=2 Tax=Arsukibacterium TaxID=336830 RepID=UPI000C62F4C7|nr:MULTISPECIES: cytochrome c oxidase accessory protein CcoG [unclassified Arsukibacterium]MAA94645.1 cytochrome c oxidase accessory protein CcoG [Rheinheimera sp.]MBM32771.1 cytochrome c oxidase accessory protein CcoG [Rheinheimera sp.]HAW93407.1 cytochrome c oxidase accessory protein CcoG [Candidatus Azambacteria bacterium]